MKRLVGLSIALVFLFAVSASHMLLSAPNGPPDKLGKVKICHVADEDDGGPHVIEVSGNGKAVQMHVEKHGDCVIDMDAAADVAVDWPCDPTDDEDPDENMCDNTPTDPEA